MRKHPLAAALLCAGLSACQTPSGSGGPSVGTIAGTASTISTDINLACDSAQQILALPGTQQGVAAGLGKVASSAAGLSTQIGAYCALGQLAGPILTQALSAVNTQAATVLGTGVAAKK